METILKNSYPIYISERLLLNFNFKKYSKCAIIVDENTKKFCLPKLVKQNANLETAQIIEIDSGERNKNLNTCQKICKNLNNSSFDRNSLIKIGFKLWTLGSP